MLFVHQNSSFTYWNMQWYDIHNSSVAFIEAEDISLHLKPLRGLLEDIEQGDFQYSSRSLPSLMHVVCLIWGESVYYSTPERIIVLVQEICNLLIEKVAIQNMYCFFCWKICSCYGDLALPKTLTVANIRFVMNAGMYGSWRVPRKYVEKSRKCFNSAVSGDTRSRPIANKLACFGKLPTSWNIPMLVCFG